MARSGDVPVHVINEAGAPREVLDGAEAEASAIWASAGLRLIWTPSHAPTDGTDSCRLIVIVRHTLSRPRLPVDADSPVGAHPLLGRIAFGENDQPGNLIEVSLTALTSRVMGASQHGVTISDRPVFIQLPLLGRGLGRVIAHEIGHWAIGRGHTQDGLMKPSFGVVDLVERTAPAVPAGLMEARVCADRLASPTRGLTERR